MEKTTEKVKQFWEQASCGTNITTAEKYSPEYFRQVEAYRYRYEPFIPGFAEFDRWKGKEMLEVGIGAGTDFLQFVRAGAIANGVDLTEEAIRNVGHRLEINGLKAKSIQSCNAEKLPFADNTFDLVYSWGVIHHADNMEKVFSEIYRVTKPGGTVKIMVYNLLSVYTMQMYLRHCVLKGRLHRGPRWAIYNYQESFATKVYTKAGLTKMLAEYPHEDLKFHFWEPHTPHGVKLEHIRRFLEKLYPTPLKWYLAFEFKKI